MKIIHMCQKPFSFHWLPRDSLALSTADEIGRFFDEANKNAPSEFIEYIEKTFHIGNN